MNTRIIAGIFSKLSKRGRIITGVILAALVIAGGWWIKATFFEAGSWLVTEDKSVVWAIRYDASGGDIRMYGMEHPWGRCVLMAGTRNSTAECEWGKDDIATGTRNRSEGASDDGRSR